MSALSIRSAVPADLETMTRLEAEGFPAEERAGRDRLEGRLRTYPDHFWLLEREGQVLAMLNGMATDERDLRDEMYRDPRLHRAEGGWQMIFSLVTAADHRCRGYAGRLLRAAILDARQKGRKGLVLTCKEELTHYYAAFGFCNEGVSSSSHGGARWYQMRLTFCDHSIS